MDSLDTVHACYTVHLPSVQSTYPEFLDVQQPSYLKGLVGMWKFWINVRSLEISSQQNSQVEKTRSPGKYAHMEAHNAEKEGLVHLYRCSNHPYLF